MDKNHWTFWIDVGGTFTDCVALNPHGELLTYKTLSSGRQKGCVDLHTANTITDSSLSVFPDQFFSGYTLYYQQKTFSVCSFINGTLYLADDVSENFCQGEPFELWGKEEAPIFAIRSLMKLGLNAPIGPITVHLGTTRGTNALLERKGCRLAFITTKGFADVPVIGTQARKELFSLKIQQSTPLFQWVVEVKERINQKGKITEPIDEKLIREQLLTLQLQQVDAVAICLLNAYKNPKHEQIIQQIAEELGFSHVTTSSSLAKTIGFLPRAGTTLIDAYLGPVVRDYVETIQKSIPEGTLEMMTSAGGLVPARAFSGKDSLLSGPAGGVVGLSEMAKTHGITAALGFDMGGTSTDVSRWAGSYEYCFQAEEDGLPLIAPMLSIHTVAAGGGSICSFDGQRLLVGPESAGSNPGPACYGRSGPLTITDINLFTGKVATEHFPFALDREAVSQRLDQIIDKIQKSTGIHYTKEQLAAGFTEIANEKMATAIKTMSHAKGFDPTMHTLIAFGGAGAQHACAIAERLGIRSILLPPLSGILSAYGIGVANCTRFTEQSCLLPLTEKTEKTLVHLFSTMDQELIEKMKKEHPHHCEKITIEHSADLRYRGEDASITVAFEETKEDTIAAFEKMHEQLLGLKHQGREIEVATVRSKATLHREQPQLPKIKNTTPAKPIGQTTISFSEKPIQCPVYRKEDLCPEQTIKGPFLLTDSLSTIVIDPGWTATFSEWGGLLLHCKVQKLQQCSSTEKDPIQLELFHNAFAYIATQMGAALQKASLSVNVKERLDFSCAVLDQKGRLIANAPHIPVHLGAMSESVKGLIRDQKTVQEGDVFLTNDPASGGSHLPDLTCITPVFIEGKLEFFVASRAHHAEIGGVTPGSFYPFAKNLAEEGVVIRNKKIAEKGQILLKELHQILSDADYPSRAPEENIADIQAAIAANHIGEKELSTLVATHSWPVVRAYMEHIRASSREKVEKALQEFPDALYTFSDALDSGSQITVAITIKGKKAIMDFTGSAQVNQNALNANRAVVTAAVIYCMRCLIDEEIPLNEGMLEPITLVLPEGMLNPSAKGAPKDRAAVVAGNVEISQRVCDVILGALQKAAASQGTMNNVIFGNEHFGYYETIGGGVGACQGYNGASAVHTHMTNTRITDAEILEHRYPVELRRFAIRKGSGGEGVQQGGNGIIREFVFLQDLDLTLLTQRRESAPFGMKGGEPGRSGCNLLFRKGQDAEPLPPLAQVKVHKGDRLRVKTPGGGGWGEKV